MKCGLPGDVDLVNAATDPTTSVPDLFQMLNEIAIDTGMLMKVLLIKHLLVKQQEILKYTRDKRNRDLQ